MIALCGAVYYMAIGVKVFTLVYQFKDATGVLPTEELNFHYSGVLSVLPFSSPAYKGLGAMCILTSLTFFADLIVSGLQHFKVL